MMPLYRRRSKRSAVADLTTRMPTSVPSICPSMSLDRCIAARLARRIKNLIGVSAVVRVMPVGGVERSLGKARRVVDKRSL